MAYVEIGPSILTANLLELGESIKEAERAGVDNIHMDIMDGHYVPNITFGPVIVRAVRKGTSLPVDTHLMIEQPERYIEEFAEAGSDALTIHVEACRHLHATITHIRSLGVSPGVAMNPTTPLVAVEEALPFVDQVLLMSVNPGFGGQTFIPESLSRISRLRAMMNERNPACKILVDGGIKASNIGSVARAGASKIVAGSAIFTDDMSVADAVAALRQGTNNQGN